MRFDVLTLFPELFEPHLRHGVTRRAFETRAVDVRLWPLRDFGEGPHRRVDDRPFGGGPGMVMQPGALWRAVQAVRADRAQGDGDGDGDGGHGRIARATLVSFGPAGQRLSQDLVRRFVQGDGAVLLCGRYEGIDQRFVDRHVDVEISLGDFVLSGGEIAALALLDAVARLQEGVLNDPQSHQQDSFDAGSGLLDCAHYTQPAHWEGVDVPAVLTSGHHAQIERWRRHSALETTLRLRPDLIDAARKRGALDAADEAYLRTLSRTDT
jgi:tRNA (guanine37-N1)-methyltransferase